MSCEFVSIISNDDWGLMGIIPKENDGPEEDVSVNIITGMPTPTNGILTSSSLKKNNIISKNTKGITQPLPVFAAPMDFYNNDLTTPIVPMGSTSSARVLTGWYDS